MGWKCKICGKDYGGRKTDPAPPCFAKPACKKKGEFACEWEDEKEAKWTFATAQLTKPAKLKEATEDLDTLIDRAGNIYSTTIGTVVGGVAIKSGKRVQGLNDPNARIDIQSPPQRGSYNVQYQIGDNSAACVIFTAEDEEDDVFENLRESLKKCKKATSPNVE